MYLILGDAIFKIWVFPKDVAEGFMGLSEINGVIHAP